MSQPKLLEVIAVNVGDAIEAQAGGADRLEIVRDLQLAGLTPHLDTVKQILDKVSIPIRVMLREHNCFVIQGDDELARLCELAASIDQLGVEGIVTGYTRNTKPDLDSVRRISECAPASRITFHRAFDSIPDPAHTIALLKTIPAIDNILTVGGLDNNHDPWPQRRARLENWQTAAQPQIHLLVAAGLDEQILSDIAASRCLHSVHAGRAARLSPEPQSPVSRARVARLKALLS